MSDVPVVSHAIRIAHWWPTILLHCKCVPGDDPTLMVITVLGQPVQCLRCGHKATAVMTVVDGKPTIAVSVTIESHIALGN